MGQLIKGNNNEINKTRVRAGHDRSIVINII